MSDFDYGYGDADYPEYGVSAQLEPDMHPDFVGGGAEEPAPGPPEYQSMMTHGVQNDIYAAPMPQPPLPQERGMPMNTQAVGQAPNGGTHSLGVSLLAVGVGGAVGGKYGGWAGAGAGVLFAGAAINAMRAFKSYQAGSDEGDKEGRVSALYTLVGAGGGALLWGKYADKRMARNPDRDHPETEETDFGMPCGIRSVGP